MFSTAPASRHFRAAGPLHAPLVIQHGTGPGTARFICVLPESRDVVPFGRLSRSSIACGRSQPEYGLMLDSYQAPSPPIIFAHPTAVYFPFPALRRAPEAKRTHPRIDLGPAQSQPSSLSSQACLAAWAAIPDLSVCAWHTAGDCLDGMYRTRAEWRHFKVVRTPCS